MSDSAEAPAGTQSRAATAMPDKMTPGSLKGDSTIPVILTARIVLRWVAISMRFSRELDLWEQRKTGRAALWLWRLMGPDATERMALEAATCWPIWAGRAQTPPAAAGSWRTWLMMGGRGAGKTRAGAEWVRAQVKAGARRIALVGPTLSDVREVMIEGPSGLRAVGMQDERPVYSVTRRRLLWPNGAEGFAFSSEDPDSLRGPQFDAAWCDEIAAWAKPDQTWDMLMFGLRLGRRPRVVATTTPRAISLVKRLVAQAGREDGGVVLSRAATEANAHNLAPGFIDAMRLAYEGSHRGRQELDGELVEDLEGAMFIRKWIDQGRVVVSDVGDMERVVVGVDPPATAAGDACGIIAAGLKDGVVYVLADASVRGLPPLGWAQRAVAAARACGAAEIAAESNQGGEMVREILEMAGARLSEGLKVTLKHAKESKRDRALPVSGEVERGTVRCAGVFRELEDEMCAFGVPDAGRGSPDRVDALVWAVRTLRAKSGPPPRMIPLGSER